MRPPLPCLPSSFPARVSPGSRGRRRLRALVTIGALFAFFALGCADQIVSERVDATPSSSCAAYTAPDTRDLSGFHDPGRGAWELVARDDLVSLCGLDPDILDEIDAVTGYPYAIVRHGRLCHEHQPVDQPGPDDATEMGSATKTLVATVVGRVATLSAPLDEPLCDTDRMDAWVDDIDFNPRARVAHVLGMVAASERLGYGERVFEYDATGGVVLERLGDVIRAVLAQDPAVFGGARTTEEVAQRELFDRLGMAQSTWEGRLFGYGWSASQRDMARLGLLLLHDGVWEGERLVHEEWVYRMTHPAFEDANTAYGYLTWLAASDGYSLPAFPGEREEPIGLCQPPALWPAYPHAPSGAPDCGYATHPCGQTYDVGVFGAVGYGGQFIVGHRGLDLVLVARNAGNLAFLQSTWDRIRPALVAHDPEYAGDEAAFCAAYAAGAYAPDLLTAE